MRQIVKQVIKDTKEHLKYLKYKDVLPEKIYYDDTYIVEFPKSGVTWLTFLLSNIIVKENDLDIQINFFNNNDFVLDIHTSKKDLFRKVEKPGYRIFKSHSAYNPYYRKVIYLWRNPKNVMKSYFRMMKGLGYFNGSFLEFVKNDNYGIKSWVEHVSKWLYESNMNQRMYFINYDDLRLDTEKEIKQLLKAVGWNVKAESLQYAITNSQKEYMKRLEDERFENDIRWKMDRVAENYRFIENETEIENEKEAIIFIEKFSANLYNKLKHLSGDQ